MEKEMQKLNEKLAGKNPQKTKEIEQAINVLKQEHNRSQKIYQTFRSEKLFDKISKLVAKAKKKHEENIFLRMKSMFYSEKERISKVNRFKFFI